MFVCWYIHSSCTWHASAAKLLDDTLERKLLHKPNLLHMAHKSEQLWMLTTSWITKRKSSATGCGSKQLIGLQKKDGDTSIFMTRTADASRTYWLRTIQYVLWSITEVFTQCQLNKSIADDLTNQELAADFNALPSNEYTEDYRGEFSHPAKCHGRWVLTNWQIEIVFLTNVEKIKNFCTLHLLKLMLVYIWKIQFYLVLPRDNLLLHKSTPYIA